MQYRSNRGIPYGEPHVKHPVTTLSDPIGMLPPDGWLTLYLTDFYLSDDLDLTD